MGTQARARMNGRVSFPFWPLKEAAPATAGNERHDCCTSRLAETRTQSLTTHKCKGRPAIRAVVIIARHSVPGVRETIRRARDAARLRILCHRASFGW
jgi:hypothetical protein